MIHFGNVQSEHSTEQDEIETDIDGEIIDMKSK